MIISQTCLCTLWFALWIDGKSEEADLVAIGIQGLILSLLKTKSLFLQRLHILTWLEFSYKQYLQLKNCKISFTQNFLH